jgi:hypothetical protein
MFVPSRPPSKVGAIAGRAGRVGRPHSLATKGKRDIPAPKRCAPDSDAVIAAASWNPKLRQAWAGLSVKPCRSPDGRRESDACSKKAHDGVLLPLAPWLLFAAPEDHGV